MKKSVILSLVILIVALASTAIWWSLTITNNPKEAETTTTQLPNPVIRFSGEVKAKQFARLGFEATGIVKAVRITVGDTVEAGQELIVLDRELQEAAVNSAFAQRVSNQDTTQIALEATRSAQAKTENENKQTVATARQKVIDSKKELEDAKEVFARTASENGDEAAATSSKQLAITTAEKAYNAAQAELTEARATEAKENAAAEEDVRAAEAAYAASTQASLTAGGPAALVALENSARVQLARKILVAPFTGTVTKLDLQPNELAIGGQPIITIQSMDDMEIEAQVSETNISKLAVNQLATVTLDALSDQEFSATITRIDPAGEKIDGIPRYTVYLDIENSKSSIRPGFTANVAIQQ